jgi:golgi phosphoprotein 3
MDLVLCAIDARSGQARFGPQLSYALPVAEMVHLAMAGRVALRDDRLVIIDAQPTGEAIADSALTDLHDLPATYPPLTVRSWSSWRGPHRIELYLKRAVDMGVVRIESDSRTGDKTLTVVQTEPIEQVTRRLIAAVDEPAPAIEDAAFAVLADAAGIARPLLQGRTERRHLARLSKLRDTGSASDAAQILQAGLKAIIELSRLATADPRNMDQRIGLTPAGRRAAVLFGRDAIP